MDMTRLEAILIKEMRTMLGFTWRKIAEVWCEAHNETDCSQERGRELCVISQNVLNENWEE